MGAITHIMELFCAQESCHPFWPEKVTTVHYGRHAVTLNELQSEEWDTYNLTVQEEGKPVSTSIVYITLGSIISDVAMFSPTPCYRHFISILCLPFHGIAIRGDSVSLQAVA